MADKNMTITRQEDGRLHLRCHCGTEFSIRIKKKRPQCPSCHCLFVDADWEIRNLINEEMKDAGNFQFFRLRLTRNGETSVKMAMGRTVWDVVSRLGNTLHEKNVEEFAITPDTREEYETFMAEEVRKSRAPMDELIELAEKLLR